jgi:hypothetical protein
MQRSRISQLIQMRSIGVSDTTSVDSPCHPEEIAHCRPSGGAAAVALAGFTTYSQSLALHLDRCECVLAARQSQCCHLLLRTVTGQISL